MSGAKKFGAFAGVFTPSILTILGVIMYLRLGWVVGNAGIIGTLVIIVAAHVISITTGLSISSIATDKKIGAGGVYYVLSRSLGLPIGGAIGLTLFVGTAFSIALYLIGFAESFNAWFSLGISTNDLRLGGTLALVLITAVALISTATAIKTQFWIMAFIGLSIISIFLGNTDTATVAVPLFDSSEDLPWIEVFAVFFPAVTGFTAGIAMSGDLRNPKKDIPRGTLAAIAVGFVVYIALALFIGLNLDAEELRSNNNILIGMAFWAPAVAAGIWGATLSSALGGILGGPRILQAMSLDRITPKFFGKGVRKDNEPWNALFLTVIIAEAGILIGELDLIARLVSMFYLAAYGFINLSFFLESWASADFNPSFRVKRWVGLIGFVATFGLMFQLDALAMMAAVVIIMGIYFWLARKQVSLGTGDIWQSVWSSVVRTGLRRMDSSEDHQRNWKPNILLFSGATEDRPHLLDMSKWLADRTGMVTNFDLTEGSGDGTPVGERSIQDEALTERGIFGRKLEVNDIYSGIETIASTFGFSGVEPNTVLMGWGRNTKEPDRLAHATRTLMGLDHNVLFLDFDHRFGFRNKESIDLWWRGLGPNTSLMLDLAKFIMNSPEWSQANLRIIVVQTDEIDLEQTEERVAELLEQRRLQAQVKVLRKKTNETTFYQLMKDHAMETDLVLVGIPEVKDIHAFVHNTNDLVGTIGTTLLVAASSKFKSNEVVIKRVRSNTRREQTSSLPPMLEAPPTLQREVEGYESKMERALLDLQEIALAPYREYHMGVLAKVREAYNRYFSALENGTGRTRLDDATDALMHNMVLIIRELRTNSIPALAQAHAKGIQQYVQVSHTAYKELPLTIKRVPNAEELVMAPGDNKALRKIKTRWAKGSWWGPKQIRVPLRKVAKAKQGATFLHSCQYSFNTNGIARSQMLLAWEARFVTPISNMVKALLTEQGDDPLQVAQCALDEALLETEQELTRTEDGLMRELRSAQRHLCNKILSTALRLDVEEYMEAREGKGALAARKRRLRLAGLARLWGSNRELDLLHFEAATAVKALAMKARIQLQFLTVHTRSKYFRGMRMTAKYLIEQLQLLEGTSAAPSDLANIRIEEHVFGNATLTLQRMASAMNEAHTFLPQLVEIRSNQGGTLQDQYTDVKSLDLELDKICDHLLDHGLYAPLRQKMDEVVQGMDRAQAQLLGTLELLEHNLREGEEKQKHIVDAKKECEQVLEGVEEQMRKFELHLTELGNDLEGTLDMAQITQHADHLQQYVKRAHRLRGLEEWLQPVQERLMATYRELRTLIRQRKKDEAHIAYQHHYEHLQDPFGQAKAHLDALALPPENDAALPYHYKQLFRGKHVGLGRVLLARNTEMAKAKKALERMEQGGAILVLGAGGSGKSFFCEHLASNLLERHIYRVGPVGKRSGQALLTALGQSMEVEDPTKSLQSIEPATFIFHNLEGWWLRSLEQQEALETIADLIDRHGIRHRFILECCVHSYAAIAKQCSIQDRLVETINLPPLEAADMRAIIFERQRGSGLALLHRGRRVNLESQEAMAGPFRKLATLSQGNIGLALRLWLASIVPIDGEQVRFGELQMHPFPPLNERVWKGLLYQFVLHHDLSREDVFQLFQDHGKEHLVRVLGSMTRSGILQSTDLGNMYLNPEQRPYIEQWMKAQEILH